MKSTCKYELPRELHTLPNIEVSPAKDHGENYMKVRQSMVRHLLRYRLLSIVDTINLISFRYCDR